jgi:hypothetical protein
MWHRLQRCPASESGRPLAREVFQQLRVSWNRVAGNQRPGRRGRISSTRRPQDPAAEARRAHTTPETPRVGLPGPGGAHYYHHSRLARTKERRARGFAMQPGSTGTFGKSQLGGSPPRSDSDRQVRTARQAQCWAIERWEKPKITLPALDALPEPSRESQPAGRPGAQPAELSAQRGRGSLLSGGARPAPQATRPRRWKKAARRSPERSPPRPPLWLTAPRRGSVLPRVVPQPRPRRQSLPAPSLQDAGPPGASEPSPQRARRAMGAGGRRAPGCAAAASGGAVRSQPARAGGVWVKGAEGGTRRAPGLRWREEETATSPESGEGVFRGIWGLGMGKGNRHPRPPAEPLLLARPALSSSPGTPGTQSSAAFLPLGPVSTHPCLARPRCL